jgi:hypothetical protein
LSDDLPFGHDFLNNNFRLLDWNERLEKNLFMFQLFEFDINSHDLPLRC